MEGTQQQHLHLITIHNKVGLFAAVSSMLGNPEHIDVNDDSRITKSVSGLSDCRKPAWSMLLPTCDGRGGVCRLGGERVDERWICPSTCACVCMRSH